ncbi:coagulation factor 5/8 type domain-containing protein, partial [Streptomyces sp. NPDC006195]
MPTPPTRRTVLGVMAAAASAPSMLALSSPASASASTRNGAAALPGGGDLGPNVVVFDPSTPNIQGRLDEIFRQQES